MVTQWNFGFGVLTVLFAAWSSVSVAAEVRSSGYPNRPVRFIVAQAAGGNADFVARMVAAELAKQLGQQFVVDNRSGGGGSHLAGHLRAARRSGTGDPSA